jgi:hypothetical protein
MPQHLRPLTAPYVVAPPAGVRIRTRLRPLAADEVVLHEVGEYLGRLAGRDLAERCRVGCGDPDRTRRKRSLTAAASSRWAGAITRTSQDQWERGHRNLLDERAGLQRSIRHLRARLTAPVGGRAGRVRGYPSRTERWQKQRRLHLLTARLARIDVRIAKGRVSVVRGGRRCSKPASTWRRLGSPSSNGASDGTQRAGFSPQTETRRTRSVTAPSWCTRKAIGWR